MTRPDVLALFARQYGVADTAQLVALGVSPRTIGRARQRGLMTVVLPGVCRHAGYPDTFESRAMAVQLHCGERSFLTGPTAAALSGIRGMPRNLIYVTICGRARVKLPRWVIATRTRWLNPGDVMTRPDGLRVARAGRMLLALAEYFNDHRFARAAEDAWHLGLITPPNARRYLDEVRRSGRRGIARFERWVVHAERRAKPAQSGLELDVLDAVVAAGLPEPVRQHPLRLLTGELIHLDLAWPDVNLAVEPGHSWYHGGDLGTRRDVARDTACGEVGWQVIRCDESARKDLASFAAQVANTYARRQPGRSALVRDSGHG